MERVFKGKYYYLIKIVAIFVNLFSKKPKIMCFEETINYILKNGCSVSRFGDGEFNLCLYDCYDLFFQKYDKNLSLKLLEALNSNDNGNVLLCLPSSLTLRYRLNLTKTPRRFWRNVLIYEYPLLKKHIDMNSVFGDSLFTRFYMDYKNKSKKNISKKVCLIKKIWDKRDIMIVEGLDTKLGIGNDLFSNCNSITRIITQSKNAFSLYEKIFNKIKETYINQQLVLVSLGPTATVLTYDLSKCGIQAIDIGHIDIEYIWYLSGAKEKIRINGKHSAEALSTSSTAIEINEAMCPSDVIYYVLD